MILGLTHCPGAYIHGQLTVEISGEGEVKLLGTGGKAGTKGGLTLRFKRVDL